jgi:hypothetical protein
MLAMALDADSGIPFHWDGLGGTRSCGLSFTLGSFNRVDAGVNSLEYYLQQYQYGDVIVLTSTGNANLPAWSVSFKDLLHSMGSTLIDSVESGIPYHAIFKIGEGLVFEAYGDSTDQSLELNIDLSFNAVNGSISTPLIYGAGRWEKFSVGTLVDSIDSGDLVFLKSPEGDSLLDISGNKIDTVVFSDGFNVSLTEIDSVEHARIVFDVSDTVFRTPIEIDHWVVNFDPIMELLIANSTREELMNSTKRINAGELAEWSLVFQNVSQGGSEDSIQILVTVQGDGYYELDTLIVSKSFGLDSVQFDFELVTVGLSGIYQVQLKLNPEVEPEQFYDNNYINFEMEVIPDLTTPILEVTYDGYYIQNGDFISSNPEIEISLREYNDFLKRTDTLNWSMELAEHCETSCVYSNLYFGSSDVSYSVGSITDDFTVLYTPEFLAGVYRLKIEASDASGNYAGSYEQEFEVSDQTGLSYFYPYPNPFSGSCRFVYRFLGEVVPTDFSLLITTLSGHTVRELSAEDLGGIRIGTNLSEYYWDGTDAKGTKLANGVYLYKVIVNDGTPLLETDADGLIKGGVGKLYIAN